MRIRNVHERVMVGPREVAAGLVDGLSGPNDRLWPGDAWPSLQLDMPLCVGAAGGHGPVRYRVSEYEPGRKVAFRFDNSGLAAGLDGGHYFEVAERGEQVTLRHVIEAKCDLRTWLHWLLLIEPLHDALLEDALDRAELAVNPSFSGSSRWSLWVRFLRFLVKKTSPH